MCSVYKSALLNIAADDAFDARGGCFRKRATSMVRPLEFYMPGLDESWYATIDERNMFDWMRRAPLSTRAWVLQERQLARRILDFTGQELVWECCAGGQYFASETFPSGAPLKRIFDGKPKIQAQGITTKLEQSTDGLYRQWDSLCVAYSELLLSHQSDKLLALSGLAKEFQTFLPEDTYVAGLWRNTLPRSLQWTAGRNSLLGPPRRRPNVAPSWSWASIEGPIKAAELPRDRKHREVSKIVRIHVEPEFGDPTGRIREAHMDICGFLRPVTIEDNHKENGTFPPTFDSRRELRFHGGGQAVTDRAVGIDGFSYSLDLGGEQEIVEGYFLFIDIRVRDRNTSNCISGLLLEITETANTYKRLGTLSVRGSDTMTMRYRSKEHRKDQDEGWMALKKALMPTRSEHQEEECSEARLLEDTKPRRKNVAKETADPAALYADDHGYEDPRFERLTAQTIRLI